MSRKRGLLKNILLNTAEYFFGILHQIPPRMESGKRLEWLKRGSSIPFLQVEWNERVIRRYQSFH